MMTDDKKLLLRMPSKLHEQIRLLAGAEPPQRQRTDFDLD